MAQLGRMIVTIYLLPYLKYVAATFSLQSHRQRQKQQIFHVKVSCPKES
jgi:hypothetical protein